MARVSASAAALSLLFSSLAVHAQVPEPIALEWHAPEGCPSAHEVLERVRHLSAEWPPSGAPLVAAARIVRTHTGFHLELQVRAGSAVGDRQIDGKACESLANAVAIHLALLLRDAGAIRESPEAAPLEGARAEERGTDTAADAEQRNPAAREEASQLASIEDQREETGASQPRSWHVLLHLPLGAAQFGVLPQTSLGLALAAGMSFDRWSALVEGEAWLTRALTDPGNSGIGADVHRVSVSLRTCRAFAWEPFELAPCLKLTVEHLWARGTGRHVAARSDTATWLAAGVGVQGRLHVAAWLNLVATADGQLQTGRPELSIEDAGSLGKLGLAAITIALGLEWIF